ncbi:MAG: hypothetical protein MJ238_05400 [Bacilli bacterium]|nr:hypothetical protein [Bacilli bacterium]
MKYLFFDLECANTDGGGKICEFGYVVTDESFNIVEKDLIIINPGYDENGVRERFVTEDRVIEGLSFAFSFDTYRSAPEFPVFYDRIKNILIDKDLMIFGYAVRNDVRFLNYTLKRYGYDPFDYMAYDIAEYVKYDRDDEKSIGLGKAYTEYVGEKSDAGLTEHCSRDDSEFTMLVLKGLLAKQNMDLHSFLSKISYKPISSVKEIEREEEEKEARRCYTEYCRECRPYIYDSGYIGARISLSREAQQNIDFVNRAIDIAYKRDLLFVRFGNETDYLLCISEEEYKSRKRQNANLHPSYDLILIDELEEL